MSAKSLKTPYLNIMCWRYDPTIAEIAETGAEGRAIVDEVQRLRFIQHFTAEFLLQLDHALKFNNVINSKEYLKIIRELILPTCMASSVS